MKAYYAYIRVSTTRQGEEGVSLQEQRRAILEYASKRGITVSEWFEEQISAAKRGRPVFTRLVKTLKARKSAGLIIHKIDRGSRNLRDWSDLGELMDSGIEVHFAHESIDLHTRSGRLSADILAVVAADYIRNLREEVVKGINGRLRQGLFPFSAPVGYLNHGSGKAKTIDPVRGPLVKIAFELYASRQYSLNALQSELYARGLRTKTGKIVYMSQIATMLRNPFYMGLVRLRNRPEMYPGIHTPLVSSSTFNLVQLIIDRKRSHLKRPHTLLCRLLIRCEHCKLFLVGEIQKGHVYYRCHRTVCPTTSIREDRLESMVLAVLKDINITPDEEPILAELLRDFRQRESEVSLRLRKETEEEFERVQTSIKLLLQKFLDNSITKETFDEGHASLLMERRVCEENLAKINLDRSLYVRMEALLIELRTLCKRFCTVSLGERRAILDAVFKRFVASSHDLSFTLTPLMTHIANREKTKEGWQQVFPAN